jgi:hypothetical protein
MMSRGHLPFPLVHIGLSINSALVWLGKRIHNRQQSTGTGFKR